MGIHFVTDIEKFLKEEEIAQTIAGQKIKPWQREVGNEDYFVSFADLGSGERLPVFSQVMVPTMDEEDVEDGEEPYTHPDYVFTKSFSVLCPTGELGDKHRSVIAKKITKAEFETFAKFWPQTESEVLKTFSAN